MSPKPKPPIRVKLSDLNKPHFPALEKFSTSLRNNGFAIVQIDQNNETKLLRQSLTHCQDMGEFRFPPIGEPAEYEKLHKACFRVLFKITRQCLKALLTNHDEFRSDHPLLETLAESFSDRYRLFGHDGKDNYPFSNDQTAFAPSFFNIFHYDHGLLNTHKDRCLVTAIFVNQDANATSPRSALWVKGLSGDWVNTDALVQEDEVLILLGEEFQTLANSAGVPLWAAEHCIRVDPFGLDIERAHHRPDPATPKTGNRMSAALILSA
ncbi:MAG: hypothetical protein VYA34_05445 [Myxococcota bacterium]|nr:hypothetical protein [Myxococcota bacterium]